MFPPFFLLQPSLRMCRLTNINHVQAHSFKHTVRLGLISFSASLSSLFSNYDQMSAAVVELLIYHKSSHQSLMNGPACTHRTFLHSHALKAVASTHTHVGVQTPIHTQHQTTSFPVTHNFPTLLQTRSHCHHIWFEQ